MRLENKEISSTLILVLVISILSIFGSFILKSVAPSVFPTHMVYLGIGIFLFLLILRIDWEVFYTFSPLFFTISLILLTTTLIIGQVTRGAVRWIPLGTLSIQPSDITRAFFLLFWAKYITEKEINLVRFLKVLVLFFVPFLLIVVQPSLGVGILTAIGFLGILLSSSIPKKYFLIGLGVMFVVSPLFWLFLQPYQRERILIFWNPRKDPQGAGYNSIQAMISVGSGKIFGRGLGEGSQTQLYFLPERHTDFVFASIAEELGLFGAMLVLTLFFIMFWILVQFVNNAVDVTARTYLTGIILILFSQTLIHIGMNMGLLPITGVPLPFVSAGGSSFLGSITSIAIAIKARKG